MKITREYFSMVDYATAKLDEFIKELNCNPEVQSTAEIMYPGLRTDEYGMLLCLLFDLIRCYRDLHYEMNPETQEGFGLFHLIVYASAKDNRVARDYNLLPEILANTKAECVNAIVSLDVQRDKVPEGVFVLERILSRIDDSLVKRYFVLLYRFFSVIAKADGTVDEHESEYLAGLLDQSSEKMTEHTSNQKDQGKKDQEKNHKT